jgi:hypothetical protein
MLAANDSQRENVKEIKTSLSVSEQPSEDLVCQEKAMMLCGVAAVKNGEEKM